MRVGGAAALAYRRGLRPSLGVSALYAFPFEVGSDTLGSRTKLVSARAVAAIEVFRGRSFAIEGGGGGGLDVLAVDPTSTILPDPRSANRRRGSTRCSKRSRPSALPWRRTSCSPYRPPPTSISFRDATSPTIVATTAPSSRRGRFVRSSSSGSPSRRWARTRSKGARHAPRRRPQRKRRPRGHRDEGRDRRRRRGHRRRRVHAGGHRPRHRGDRRRERERRPLRDVERVPPGHVLRSPALRRAGRDVRPLSPCRAATTIVPSADATASRTSTTASAAPRASPDPKATSAAAKPATATGRTRPAPTAPCALGWRASAVRVGPNAAAAPSTAVAGSSQRRAPRRAGPTAGTSAARLLARSAASPPAPRSRAAGRSRA